MSIADELTTTGVWYFTETMTTPEAAELAARVESLGYSSLWLPETTGRDPFSHIAHLATATTNLLFATGIANIFHRHPGMMKQCARTLAESTGGRFVLGIGVSHAPLVAGLRNLDYSKPLTTMRDYLAAMEASPATSPPPSEAAPTVLAALGPKMLELAATAADGAHPYWTTPEHTAQAREIMGQGPMLCVEQKVCLSTDAAAARAAGVAALGIYADLPNYRNNWKRLGFSDDEIDSRSDKLIDALVGWGDEAAIRRRIRDHYDAGASHVCIQPLHPDGSFGNPDWDLLEALAPANE